MLGSAWSFSLLWCDALSLSSKDVPFKADEAAYLGHLDGRQLAVAEAELEAAEAQLEIAMKAAADASTRYEQAACVHDAEGCSWSHPGSKRETRVRVNVVLSIPAS